LVAGLGSPEEWHPLSNAKAAAMIATVNPRRAPAVGRFGEDSNPGRPPCR
jgi:hypothetical protein